MTSHFCGLPKTIRALALRPGNLPVRGELRYLAILVNNIMTLPGQLFGIYLKEIFLVESC